VLAWPPTYKQHKRASEIHSVRSMVQ
jgi:hypothetical protein